MSRGRAYPDIRDYEASSHQRIISNKSLSDTEYDVRALSTRPDPSYYGRNFKNFERGRTSTFAQGDRQEPKMPDPYVKRPQPYPPNVTEEYNRYKEYGGEFAHANARYRALEKPPHEYGRNHVDREVNWKEGLPLAKQARAAANGAGALRAGFDHKYPYAYESVEAKRTHKDQVDDCRRSGERYGGYVRNITGKLEKEKSRGEKYRP